MQIDPISLNHGPLSPSALLNQWFLDVQHLHVFEMRVLRGELDELPEEDLRLLLDYASRSGILHQAVSLEKEKFVQILVDKEVDLNVLDSHEKSCLVYAKHPEVFLYLLRKRAKYINNNPLEQPKSLLDAAFPLYPYSVCTEIIGEVITFYPEEILQASFSGKCQLLEFATNHPILKETLYNFLKILYEKDRPKAIQQTIEFLSSEKISFWPQFLTLASSKVIDSSFIEEVICSPAVLKTGIPCKEFSSILETLNIRDELQTIYKQTGNLRLSIYIHTLLHCNTLKELEPHLSILDKVQEDLCYLNEDIKILCSEHIQKLQLEERFSIWDYIASNFPINSAFLFPKIGINPNWETPLSHRHAIFFPVVIKGDLENFIRSSGVNVDHVDKFGDNALEYFCKNLPPTVDFLTKVSVFVSAGLRLSSRFPYAEECQKWLPDHPFLHTILAAYLIHQDWSLRSSLRIILNHRRLNSADFAQLSSTNIEILLTAVCHDKDLFENLQDLFSKNQRTWKECFAEEDLPLIQQREHEQRYGEWISNLASCWKSKVPSEALQIIPHFPLASLVISSIQHRHDRGLYPLAAQALFEKLQQNDMIVFSRYVFEHPSIAKLILRYYFEVEEVMLHSSGGTRYHCSVFVEAFIGKFYYLKHVANPYGSAKHHSKLFRAFEEAVEIIPVETLPSPQGAEMSNLWRTIRFKDGDNYQCYKFIKKDEALLPFSQEFKVTKIFRKLKEKHGEPYQSQFARPIGVYAVKNVPKEFTARLPSSTEGQHYVYHYEINQEGHQYLQDLPYEKYREGRTRFLNDAALMAKLGLQPDLVALNHNDQQKRKYIPLIDLVMLLSQRRSSLGFSAAGGAGRLDKPFINILYPNIRAIGLADLRDMIVSHQYNWLSMGGMKEFSHMPRPSDPRGRYFFQMHALSSTLLVDMLILVQRYINAHELNWNDPDFLQSFAHELLYGFQVLMARYTNESIENCERFALGCEIDWELMARQIAFFSDDSEKGYLSWLKEDKIPDSIYPGIHTTVRTSTASNFDPVKGFQGDIGPYNGPLGLPEFEKMLYVTVFIVALAEPLRDTPAVPFYFNDFYNLSYALG